MHISVDITTNTCLMIRIVMCIYTDILSQYFVLLHGSTALVITGIIYVGRFDDQQAGSAVLPAMNGGTQPGNCYVIQPSIPFIS